MNKNSNKKWKNVTVLKRMFLSFLLINYSFFFVICYMLFILNEIFGDIFHVSGARGVLQYAPTTGPKGCY